MALDSHIVHWQLLLIQRQPALPRRQQPELSSPRVAHLWHEVPPRLAPRRGFLLWPLTALHLLLLCSLSREAVPVAGGSWAPLLAASHGFSQREARAGQGMWVSPHSQLALVPPSWWGLHLATTAVPAEHPSPLLQSSRWCRTHYFLS